MVVISSLSSNEETVTEQGLKASPLMCDVQALQTSSPQPYFGPVIPSRSRSPHSTRTLSGQLTVTGSPFTTKRCSGIRPPQPCERPSVGDWGMGGTVGNGVKSSGRPWLIGKVVGSVLVARA